LELFVNFDPSHLAVHDDDISSAIRSLGQRIYASEKCNANACK
jgi:sugar phosphate isomerase/epimerase